jgi:hypothetical protein
LAQAQSGEREREFASLLARKETEITNLVNGNAEDIAKKDSLLKQQRE